MKSLKICMIYIVIKKVMHGNLKPERVIIMKCRGEIDVGIIGYRYNSKCDVFAACVVLYNMLT